jgi:hypothetical protein
MYQRRLWLRSARGRRLLVVVSKILYNNVLLTISEPSPHLVECWQVVARINVLASAVPFQKLRSLHCMGLFYSRTKLSITDILY